MERYLGLFSIRSLTFNLIFTGNKAVFDDIFFQKT